MNQNFKALRSKVTLSKEIEQHIENLIRTKKLLPGEKLPKEIELCEMLSVSRTSLREALSKLSARGLIRIKKASGIYVNDFNSKSAIDSLSLYLDLNFSKEYILHVIHVRQILEPQIAKLAAENRSAGDLETLAGIIEELIHCAPEDFDQQGELDRRFHSRITMASLNPVLPVIMEPIFHQMPKMRSIVYKTVDMALSSALTYHQKIYQAISEQNGNLAFETMAKHLEFAEEHSQEIDEII